MHTIPTVCAATATSTAVPTESEVGPTSPPSRSRHIHIRRPWPETFASHQREVIGVQLAIRQSMLQLALLLCDARVCWPAAFTLRDPCCDFFGRIESHVRAYDRNGFPSGTREHTKSDSITLPGCETKTYPFRLGSASQSVCRLRVCHPGG